MTEAKGRAVSPWSPIEELGGLGPWVGLSELRRRMDEIFGERGRVGMVVPPVDVTEWMTRT